MQTTRTHPTSPDTSAFQWPDAKGMALIAASTAMPYLLAAILVML